VLIVSAGATRKFKFVTNDLEQNDGTLKLSEPNSKDIFIVVASKLFLTSKWTQTSILAVLTLAVFPELKYKCLLKS
jgi:hypothetical protein